MPLPLHHGAYTATPIAPLDATGACRWKLVGPGMDRRTRFLLRDEMVGEMLMLLRDVAPGAR